MLKKAKEANLAAKTANRLASNAKTRIDELVAEFKKIDYELDSIPWYNPFKRWSTRRRLEKVRICLCPAQEYADLRYKWAHDAKVRASDIGQLAETELISQQLSNNLIDVDSIFKWLSNPPIIYAASTLKENKKLIPKTKGIYAWYFAREELDVPTNSYFTVKDFELLYVGIAGKKLEGKGNLRSRIGSQHITGNAEGSSLRFNLGILLQRKGFPITLEKKSLKRIQWSNEDALTNWICDNAWVAWIEHKSPLLVEKIAVENFGRLLPLNYEHNEKNIFAQNLKKERDEMRSEVLKRKK